MVVTGAAQGIGAGIALAFQEDGCDVVVLDLKLPEAPTPGVSYVEADISDPVSVEKTFAALDRVDVLVNNAGIARSGLVDQQPGEDFIKVVETNLIGAFLCAAQAVPRMPEGGSIVSISSTAAMLGLPGRGAYSAAKAGLLGLTRVWGVELAPRGIRANAVCPGWIRTPLAEQGLRDGSLQLDWMMRRVPAKRLAEVQEIARIVRFLASDEASFITGQSIVADGGWTVQGIDESPDWLS